MSLELAKQYKPSEIEPAITQRWDEAKAFHPNAEDPGAPYAIMIPPPNVTAALHLGHALNNTLQDILIRWRRMLGDNTLWMPGTDHAGIATQTVVEKRVLAEEKKRRTDFARDEFVAKIQAWKDEYETRILGQLKAMGCSCDWLRTRFTMDPICARAVREAFFRLFQDGLIYRGKRLVNWDPATQTALADDEVEMEEVDGQFYYLHYPLADGSGHVTVATTRPETMLGDTAVAINPRDPRAAQFEGKMVRLPIVNRPIPIIKDEYVVLPVDHGGDLNDPKAVFSSGFLKVTPAHDPNDYALGLKYNLQIINVLSPTATISREHGWPANEWEPDFGNEAEFVLGMDRYEAREAIVEWFRQEKLLGEIKPYRHSVGHSYRSHVAIEPYLSDQWYVKVTDPRLAGAALKAMSQRETPVGKVVERSGAPWEGKLNFVPARYAKTFQTWHENIRDWCISRQLWWGHRIPVWSIPCADAHTIETVPEDARQLAARLGIAGKDVVVRPRPNIDLADVKQAVDQGRESPHEFNRQRIGAPIGYVDVCLRQEHPDFIREITNWGGIQDPDVLDTWFSSALWPISTLGWPEDSPQLRTWNPSSCLSTAREIITLWVSRMVMFNLYFRDCLPFYDVFVHAMIQDGEGRKMSKSLGNGVDPLDIIDSHGADAMRFTLTLMTTQTQDVRLPVQMDAARGRNTSPKFDIGRNFANKLWNAVRFALGNLEESRAAGGESANPSPASAAGSAAAAELTLPDRWILSRLCAAVNQSERALNNYDFNPYAQDLYDFIWRDLCDWYIEAIKPTVRSSSAQQQALASVLDVTLRLLHPVMPYITEKLWEELQRIAGDRPTAALFQGAQAAGQVRRSSLLCHAPFPAAPPSMIDAGAEEAFAHVQGLVSAMREVRTTHKIPPRQNVIVSIKCGQRETGQTLAQRGLIESLANVSLHHVGPDAARPEGAAASVIGATEIYLHDVVDVDTERGRLSKRLDDLARSIKTLEGRLASKSYTEKAPPHLVQQTRDQLVAAEKERQNLQAQLGALPG